MSTKKQDLVPVPLYGRHGGILYNAKLPEFTTWPTVLAYEGRHFLLSKMDNKEPVYKETYVFRA